VIDSRAVIAFWQAIKGRPASKQLSARLAQINLQSAIICSHNELPRRSEQESALSRKGSPASYLRW
jgi:hypothetical protein